MMHFLHDWNPKNLSYQNLKPMEYQERWLQLSKSVSKPPYALSEYVVEVEGAITKRNLEEF